VRPVGLGLVLVGAAIAAMGFIWYVRTWLERAPHPRVQSRISSILDAIVDFQDGWIRRLGGRRLRKPLLLFLVGDLAIVLGLVLTARDV
jgi:hypothetical protein